MSGDIIIAQWPRNARETIMVKLGEYQGNPVFDIRTWYDGGDGLKPGRSGITLALKHLPQMAEAVNKALMLASSPLPESGDGYQNE